MAPLSDGMNEGSLRPHESMRRMIADAAHEPYRAFESLAEALEDPDAVAILEGDDGGQIYAVVPVGKVKCSTETLNALLGQLDSIAWPGNDPDSKRIYFERQPAGAGIPSGMGGAVSTGDIWVHPEFVKLGLVTDIRDVIEGRQDRVHMTPQL